MIKEWLKNIVRLYLPVYKYESENLKFMYAGYSPSKRNYYARLFLDAPDNHTFMCRRFFWTIPKLIKDYNPHIVISEISPFLLNQFRKYNGYIVPEWATMIINIDRPMSEICKRNVTDFHDVKRLIRKYNLTYEILNDKESFSFFYDRLYVPFAKMRYGNEAWINDMNVILKSSPPPELLAVRENEEIVGAVLIQKSEDTLCLLYLGLIDGNDKYRHHGVIGAIYYFGILEAKKTGCKYLNVGGTRPFLTDRLTRYKMGLGAEFVQELTSKRFFLWLGINESSQVSKKLIESKPFMHLSDGYKLSSTEHK